MYAAAAIRYGRRQDSLEILGFYEDRQILGGHVVYINRDRIQKMQAFFVGPRVILCVRAAEKARIDVCVRSRAGDV
jgi:hypothetical protein